jgi:hypothetical protein
MQPTCVVSRCSRHRGAHGICGRHWSLLPAVIQVRVVEAHRAVKARPGDKAAQVAFEVVQEHAVRMLEG